MNKIHLIGNLTHDPEIAKTPTGITRCRFVIAVNRRHSKEGENAVDYFSITTWRQLGEICGKYLSKGKKVAVIGELQFSKYTDKNGVEKTTHTVIADEIEFLTKKAEQQAEPTGQEEPMDSGGLIDVEDNDTLPF